MFATITSILRESDANPLKRPLGDMPAAGTKYAAVPGASICFPVSSFSMLTSDARAMFAGKRENAKNAAHITDKVLFFLYKKTAPLRFPQASPEP
jgi:hypothetical protein